jgi:hypothetical protein
MALFCIKKQTKTSKRAYRTAKLGRLRQGLWLGRNLVAGAYIQRVRAPKKSYAKAL